MGSDKTVGLVQEGPFNMKSCQHLPYHFILLACPHQSLELPFHPLHGVRDHGGEGARRAVLQHCLTGHPGLLRGQGSGIEIYSGVAVDLEIKELHR